MATILKAGNVASGAQITSDSTGILEIKTGTGAGTTAMVLDASQNVGIGTSSPDSFANFVFVEAGSNVTKQGVFQATDGTTKVAMYSTSGLGIVSTRTAHPLALFTNGSERARIDTNGNFQFNSGYGSVATAYGCRAWVNFNGAANTNLSGTYSQSGTTVTVTATAHGLITGNSVYLDFTTGTAVDGVYTVTVTDANTFTVTQASRTTSGNVTLIRSTIRASGNVSSITDNGVGDYTVNFTTAMPDANYCAVSQASRDNNNGFAAFVAHGLADSQTTTSCRVVNGYDSGVFDILRCNVAIFR